MKSWIRSGRFLKWLGWGGLVLILAAALWLGRDHLIALVAVIRNRDAVVAYLEPLGLWGPLIYIFILVVQVLTVVVPAHAILVAGGYLYGFWGGLGLNFIAVVGASQIAFIIARSGGKPLVDRVVPDNILERWNHVIQKQGFFFFLTLYWFPIIPSNFTNYIAGLSRISALLFFAANVLGRLPGLALLTLVGSHGLELTWQQWAIIIPIAIVVIIGGRVISTKLEQRFQSSG